MVAVDEHQPAAVVVHGLLRRDSIVAWVECESCDKIAKREMRLGLRPRPLCDSGLWLIIPNPAKRINSGVCI